jgi:hypothetical protein
MLAGLVAALHAADPAADVELIETHISVVIVAGGYAYKFKKALDNGFLDFTTLARRWHCCHEELRLNRRLASALYLDVAVVTGSAEVPLLGGSGPMLDCAVRMRAFAQDGLWDRLAARGELGAAQIDALVALLAAFHRGAAVAAASGRYGSPAQVRAPMRANLDDLARLLADRVDRARLRALRRWEAGAFAAREAVFAARQSSGWVRECHGDLHLGNVVQIDGRTTVFDGVEFNDDFRWIDLMSEIAFMAMDLQAHGRTDLASRFVNGCFERNGDYAGARVLRYYLVHRALVRAKVAALRAAQPGAADASASLAGATRYLALAARMSAPAPARLIITHGASGSGKTTQTQGLIEAEGVIRVRADLERKRLFGIDPLARSGSALHAGLYSSAASDATHARLLEAAAAVLDGGFSAVLDATYLRRHRRNAARRLAASRGAGFVILDFDVDEQTLRERVRERAARSDDASDADLQVLEDQLRNAEPLGADEQAAAIRCTGAAAPIRLPEQ